MTKIRKRQWWVITCETPDDPEEVVGYRKALAFRRKEDAKVSFKQAGYRAKLKKPDGEVFKYRIRRIVF